jgi:hypothetical protein
MRNLHRWPVLGILLLAGCREALPGPPEKTGVTFLLSGADTRTTATSGEGRVNDWTLLLFREGSLAESGVSASDGPIRCSLEAGAYTAVAVANPPSSFQARQQLDYQAFSGIESVLEDNSPSRLVMVGHRSLVIPPPGGEPQEIHVERLVCKAGIRKISTGFSDPLLAERPFVLKALYLTNCYGRTRLGGDLEASGIDAAASSWYNRMGFQSALGVNALLCDRDIDATITADRPYRQEHAFYFYPNPTETDSRSGSSSWSPRPTRLVIEAEIGGKTYYYPVTLPVSRRNRTYIIEEAVIRTLGSADPEGNEPGSVDITFSTAAGAWNPVLDVQENS